MTIRIRASTVTDLAAVDALLARSYPKLLKADYAPSVLVLALPIIARAQPRLLSCGTYYVAEEDGEILGAGGWTPDHRNVRLGHIRHVATDDRQLRRGIGWAILGRSLEEARSAGLSQMECWATLTAEAFYQSVGFQTEGPMTVTLDRGIEFPSLRMKMEL